MQFSPAVWPPRPIHTCESAVPAQAAVKRTAARYMRVTALPLRASPDKRKAYPQGRSHCKSDFACQTDFAVNMPAASTHAELLRNMRLLALTLFDGATFLGAIGIDLGARSVAGSKARP